MSSGSFSEESVLISSFAVEYVTSKSSTRGHLFSGSQK